MSASSEVNLKQTLRKMEYPLCAQEALNKIVELICARITSIKNMDLSLDLMAEFVFYEVDRRGHKRNYPMTPFTELQLLDILFEYLNKIPNESSRNTLFLNLFSPTTAALRLSILSNTWMQQLGSTSANSCKLAESLVNDYFHLAHNPNEKLKALPNIAPQFTANFLTAIAENYFLPKKDTMFPPIKLLQCVADWVSANPLLCVAAQQRQAVLPPGAIAMEATTPIAGLLRWCILAPIYQQNDEIYSNLYLNLLGSILEIPRSNSSKAIYAQHLSASISPLILYYYRDLKNKEDAKLGNFSILCDPAMQLSLDRFGQAIQIALSVNAIYGHLDELLNSIQQLPYNKLLSIVINRHKQNKPIIIVYARFFVYVVPIIFCLCGSDCRQSSTRCSTYPFFNLNGRVYQGHSASLRKQIIMV
ncbi:integrator complex subunit 15 [Cylas formicarius]|uniref:integrator complex subunit 15 n=1 Tax=Cylas formicarius TaxID=197179 RepID=UPI0029583F28|nr:integrator complex subunit 15 [Cylas formicarius]